MTRHHWTAPSDDIRTCTQCGRRGPMWISTLPGDAAKHSRDPLLVGMGWSDDHQGVVIGAVFAAVFVALIIFNVLGSP